MTVVRSLRARAQDLWRLTRTRAAKDTSWLLAGQMVRVVTQSVGFVVLARVLGPAELGTFAAIVGVATLVSPFVHLGAYSLAIRDVVDGVPERLITGNYLALTAFTLPPALVALLAVGHFVVPTSGWAAALAVGLGTLLGARLTSVFRGVHVARGEVWLAGLSDAALGLAYLGGAVALAAARGSFEVWAWIYCAAYLLVGVGGVLVLVARFGRPGSSLGDVRRRLQDGLHFGLGNLAENANAELDKAVLLRLASAHDAGLYAASHRAVAVALVPAMAFFGAVYRRYFSAGQKGLKHSHALAWRIAPLALGYGLLTWAALGLGAPLVARLFGAEYGESASVVRWLAPMVLLYVLSIPFLDALTGARLQHLRAYAQIAALAVGFTLNVALDPIIGWKGAAIASIAAQGALVVFAAAAAPWLERRRAGSAANASRRDAA